MLTPRQECQALRILANKYGREIPRAALRGLLHDELETPGVA